MTPDEIVDLVILGRHLQSNRISSIMRVTGGFCHQSEGEQHNGPISVLCKDQGGC